MPRKKTKITYILKLKVKASKEDELPDWGLGPGILASQEVTFDLKKVPEHYMPAQLTVVADNLIRDTVEVIIEEKK
jgi:hypothetical protein